MMDHADKTESRRPRWFRTFAFRLNLWYTLIFSASAACLFVAVYALLSFAIDRNDRELVQARLSEFAAVYNMPGPRGRLEGLKRHLRLLERAPDQQRFFIQVE